MNLRDLVGRMAIRTDKVREVMPWGNGTCVSLRFYGSCTDFR